MIDTVIYAGDVYITPETLYKAFRHMFIELDTVRNYIVFSVADGKCVILEQAYGVIDTRDTGFVFPWWFVPRYQEIGEPPFLKFIGVVMVPENSPDDDEFVEKIYSSELVHGPPSMEPATEGLEGISNVSRYWNVILVRTLEEENIEMIL